MHKCISQFIQSYYQATGDLVSQITWVSSKGTPFTMKFTFLLSVSLQTYDGGLVNQVEDLIRKSFIYTKIWIICRVFFLFLMQMTPFQ